MVNEKKLAKLESLRNKGIVNLDPMIKMLLIINCSNMVNLEYGYVGKYYALLPHIDFIKAADYAHMDKYSFFCRGSNFNDKVKSLKNKHPRSRHIDEFVKAAIRNTTKFARARAEERGITLPMLFDADNDIEYADISVLNEFKNPNNVLESMNILPTRGSAKTKRFDRLDSALMEANVKFDVYHNRLFYTDSLTNEYKVLNDFDPERFSSFLRLVFKTSTYFGMESMLLHSEEAREYVERAMKSEKFIADYESSNIIQFLDCYLEKGQFKQGMSSKVPRFYIDRKVYKTVKSGETQSRCSEIDDLIAHLCRYDAATIEVFKSRFSTFLMNDPDLKSSFDVKANILYGESGANGKTLFVKCLQRAIGDKNVILYASLTGLWKSNYQRALMCDSLISVDDQVEYVPISKTLFKLLEQFIKGQDIQARRSRRRNGAFKPCSMLVGCTNNTLSTIGKSNDINDITSVFSQHQMLWSRTDRHRDDRWFEKLESDKAAQYLLELLVLAHMKNMKAGHLLDAR